MGKNILIDPYMLYINDENEIRNNIDFFEKLIMLINDNKVVLYLYEDWYKDCEKRNIPLFPIHLDKINDKELKKYIIACNRSFLQLFSKGLRTVGIDECKGGQELISDSFILEDTKYYELAFALLTACYKSNKFEKTILKNVVKEGRRIGDSFCLKCSCGVKDYYEQYSFGELEPYIDDKTRAFMSLRNTIDRSLKGEDPVLKIAQHHDFTQKKRITDYSSIEYKNRKVLEVLRHFGFDEIVFEGFHEDNSQKAGTIVAKYVVDGEKCDIVKGDLYFDSGWKRYVRLHFPIGVGKTLIDYTQGIFSYDNISSLKEKLSL